MTISSDDHRKAFATWLRTRVESDAVTVAIFKDRGRDILYRWPTGKFTYPLLELWAEWEPEKRWAKMEYIVRDGKFDVSFTYPEDIDLKDDDLARRDRIVASHFGNKPIVYPPLGKDHFEL